MTCDLTNKIFTDEIAARKHFEAMRWPDGPVCPHCGVVDEATELKGESTRPGLYKCRACQKPFTATMGTLYERSHIPMHKWLLATHLMAASKKGHERASTLANARLRLLSHRLVHGASHPRGHAPASRRRRWPARRQRQDCRSRRNLCRWQRKEQARSKRNRRDMAAPASKPCSHLVEREGKVRSLHVPAVSGENLRPIVGANHRNSRHD